MEQSSDQTKSLSISLDDQFYTLSQVASRLHVSLATLNRWIRAGRLPAYRIGSKTVRIKARDLPDWQPSGQPLPEYLTLEQLAQRLQVSHPTVWRWIEVGLLPAHRLGPKTIRIPSDAPSALIRPVR
jgi:excisionase family DNA binding protein